MSQQTIKQQARRTAREVAERRRLARVEKERRMTDLAEQVMVALGERDQAVVAAETRAGAALREWTEVEGQTLAEMVEWCDGILTPREATRLRRLADDGGSRDESDQAGGEPADAGENAGAAPKRDLSGERVAARRLDEAGLAALRSALGDPVVLARYRAKITTVPGSECLWWTGAVSGRSTRERTDGGGHGRFWFAQGRVIIAHRFAFAVMHGVEALDDARLLGHRCDNPLCQRIAPEHVVVSSAAQNRREWSIRRNLPDSPLADPRGPRRRARELRDMARLDPELVAADLDRLRQLLGEQLTLW